MSDYQPDPQWWQASDGKFYPPETHPNYSPALPQQRTAVMTQPAQSYAEFTQPVAMAGPKQKKPVWKRWWFITLALLIAIVAIAAAAAPSEDETPPPSADADPVVPAAPAAPDSAAVPVEEVPAPVEPSPAPESNLTPSQQNAARSAESYLSFMAFSRQGLIDQLSSEFGDQFPVADATVAVDSLNVDWSAQAAASAQSYLDMSGFSCQGLIDQLSSEYGEQFTIEQATYGATQAGIC